MRLKRPRPRHRRRQRAALVRAPRRRAGRDVLRLPLQGRERALRRRRRQQEARRAAEAVSRRAPHQGRRRRRLYARQLPLGAGDADRGRGTRRARRAAVPAQLARDAHLGHRPAAVGHPHVLGHVADGLLAQPREPARHHARHRHPRRRRHRRDREHRAPHAHRQIALSRRARGRRRDRARGHRHLADHRRDLLARVVHGRHRRAVLQAVRPDGRRRGAVLAARRPPHHADDGGLLHAACPGEEGRRGAHHALLRRLPEGDAQGALPDAR